MPHPQKTFMGVSIWATYLCVVYFVPVFSQSNVNFVQRCLNKTSADSILTVNCTGIRSMQSSVAIDTSREQYSWTNLTKCIFIGCGSIVAKTPIYMENITFINATANVNGGSISVQGTTAILKNVEAYNCTTRSGSGGFMEAALNSSIRIYDSTFNLNSARNPIEGGGVLFTRDSAVVEIFNSIFRDNTAAYRGGSIYVSKGSRVELFNVSFYRGSAPTSRGGDCHVEGSLTWDTGVSEGKPAVDGLYASTSGGSLSGNNAGMIDIKNIVFRGQQVSRSGGVLHCEGCLGTFGNVSTETTHAAYNAGALFLTVGSKFTCQSCIFSNCSSNDNGGTIDISYSSSVTFINSSFNFSSTRLTGGTIMASTNSELIMQNCTISNSMVTITGDSSTMVSSGGAITCQQSSIRLERTTVRNCSSTMVGGAIFVSESREATISDSLFEGNFAPRVGGAIFSYNSQLTLQNVDWFKNVASQAGGGLFLVSDSSSNTTWTRWRGKIRFIDNWVDVGGKGSAVGLSVFGKLSIETKNITIHDAVPRYIPVINSDQQVSDAAMGYIDYDPPQNDNLVPNIMGTIFFYHATFARAVVSNRFFEGFQHVLDSTPTKVSAKYLEENSSIGLDMRVPTIQAELGNAFGGKTIQEDPKNPFIIAQKVSTSSNTSFTYYKGILDANNPVVVFRNIYIPQLERGFNGTVILSLYEASRFNHPEEFFNITLRMDECVGGNRIVDYAVDQRNKTLVKCVPIRTISNGHRISFFVASALLIVGTGCLAVFSYKFRRVGWFKVSSIYFNSIITAGCVLQFFSVIMSSIPYISTYGCMAVPWLELMGVILVTAALVIKTFRIQFTFAHSYNLKRASLTDRKLTIPLVVSALLMACFMLSWTVVDPLQIREQVMYPRSADAWVETDYCGLEGNKFNGYFIAWILFCQLCVLMSAFYVRNAPSRFNEAHSLALISYFWILIGGVLLLLSNTTLLHPNSRFTINALRVLLPTIVTVLIIHMPKLSVLVQPGKKIENAYGFIKRYIKKVTSFKLTEEFTSTFGDRDDVSASTFSGVQKASVPEPFSQNGSVNAYTTSPSFFRH